jgi:hypothetical protein
MTTKRVFGPPNEALVFSRGPLENILFRLFLVNFSEHSSLADAGLLVHVGAYARRSHRGPALCNAAQSGA